MEDSSVDPGITALQSLPSTRPLTGERSLPAHGRVSRRRRLDATYLCGAGVLVLLLAVTEAAIRDHWGRPGGVAIYLAANAAMVGTYLCLVCLLLVSRLPLLESHVGHDRMVALHRRLAPAALVLLVLHAELIVVGYAQAQQTQPLQAGLDMVAQDRWLAAATLALVVMIGLGWMSWRRARGGMRYERWWLAHLLFYVAVLASFAHEITMGTLLREWPVARFLWTASYVAVFGAIAWARVLRPAWLSWRHGLVVESVEPEASGVVSVWMRGHDLDRLGAKGGQFLQWRFLTSRWWWQTHPYSLSISPTNDHLRITVKAAGDHSRGMKRLRPGTRVWFEGPYGVFTADARHGNEVVALAAGVGVTPVRAMLEDLPRETHVTVLYRVQDAAEAPLGDELRTLSAARGWNLHVLGGGADAWVIDADLLRRFAPGVAATDLFVCGPPGFMNAVLDAARLAGVPDWRLHHEKFAFA